MKKSITISLIILALAVIVIVIINSNKTSGSAEYDEFAKCLTEKGAKMYGAWWCPHCKNQKEEFGKSWKYINYIECSTADGNTQLPECAAEEIKGYPTWEFSDKSRLSGELLFETLSSKTGCPIPD